MSRLDDLFWDWFNKKVKGARSARKTCRPTLTSRRGKRRTGSERVHLPLEAPKEER